jgi:hypothetical protein
MYIDEPVSPWLMIIVPAAKRRGSSARDSSIRS